jgi:hypothetical protein
MLRLVERVQRAGLKAKPELGIQFGAGGASTPEELEQEGTRDVGFAIDLARRCLDAGAYMIMIESEGITEEVTTWRTDVVATIARELGLEKVMFEAADPEVFGWYIKNYGPEVNLFVDHSQIVPLECLRRGIWGTKSLWAALSGRPRGPRTRLAGGCGRPRRGRDSHGRDRERRCGAAGRARPGRAPRGRRVLEGAAPAATDAVARRGPPRRDDDPREALRAPTRGQESTVSPQRRRWG